MKKIVNPCTCRCYNDKWYNAFVKIEFDNGRLSMTGVVGPKNNGDCWGSAGQCYDALLNGAPKDADGWTDEMLKKLVRIWEEWHLNDIRPYCSHQKELGWRELARKEVTLYHYRLTDKASRKQKAAEKAALDALKEGKTFTPTEEQTRYAALPYAITLHEEANGEIRADYDPKRPLYNGDKGPVETKLLGWLRPDEHPEGILTRPCPVCGYKYGSAWKTEEVPQDVIDWLFSLPDSELTPAWV